MASHSNFCAFKEDFVDEEPVVNEQGEDKKEEKQCDQNLKTSDIYVVNNIPDRFDNPEWFKGYGTSVSKNPMYRTTASDYGRLAPNVHTMPTVFYSRTQSFTNHLGPCGMYRNHSLNTGNDPSPI